MVIEVIAILGSIGLVGHILTLCVLQRSAFAGKSTTILLRALAVADAGTLLWYNLSYIIPPFPVFGFVICVTVIASSWNIVLISVERVVIVYKPLQAKTLCTKKRAVFAVVALWIMVAIISSVIVTLTYTQDMKKKKNWINLYIVFQTFYGYLPAVIILVCNVSILMKLSAVNSERRQLAPETATSNTDSLTVMLIINSLGFICLVVPSSIIIMICIYYFSSCHAKLNKFFSIDQVLIMANHTINFFLYCICGKFFRTELKLMFVSLFSKCKCKRLATPKQSIPVHAVPDSPNQPEIVRPSVLAISSQVWWDIRYAGWATTAGIPVKLGTPYGTWRPEVCSAKHIDIYGIAGFFCPSPVIGYSKQKSTTPMIFLRPKLHFVSLTVCTLEQYLTNGSENKVVLSIDSSAVAYYNICSPGQLHDQNTANSFAWYWLCAV